MDKPALKLSGWHGFRFDFAVAIAAPEPYQDDLGMPCDGTCTKETCGCGCYRSMVDIEKLDQN